VEAMHEAPAHAEMVDPCVAHSQTGHGSAVLTTSVGRRLGQQLPVSLERAEYRGDVLMRVVGMG
jgi:hypothetical protein